jgi:phosphoribosylformylglycinamidine synthase subunit PurS
MKYKATIYIRLRAQVDDSAGNAVRGACGRLSDLSISKLRIGKLIELYIDSDDEESMNEQLKILSDRLLANTVIEDWEIYKVEEI